MSTFRSSILRRHTGSHSHSRSRDHVRSIRHKEGRDQPWPQARHQHSSCHSKQGWGQQRWLLDDGLAKAVGDDSAGANGQGSLAGIIDLGVQGGGTEDGGDLMDGSLQLTVVTGNGLVASNSNGDSSVGSNNVGLHSGGDGLVGDGLGGGDNGGG